MNYFKKQVHSSKNFSIFRSSVGSYNNCSKYTTIFTILNPKNGGGAVVGLVGQGVSDLWSWKMSGWEDYTGGAVFG